MAVLKRRPRYGAQRMAIAIATLRRRVKLFSAGSIWPERCWETLKIMARRQKRLVVRDRRGDTPCSIADEETLPFKMGGTFTRRPKENICTWDHACGPILLVEKRKHYSGLAARAVVLTSIIVKDDHHL